MVQKGCGTPDVDRRWYWELGRHRDRMSFKKQVGLRRRCQGSDSLGSVDRKGER